LIELDSVGEAIREKVVLEAPNTSDLMREWMNILLEMIRMQKMVFGHFHVLEVKGEGPVVLRAEMVGELIDPQRHVFLKRIVGLACRQAATIQQTDGYQAQVTLGG